MNITNKKEIINKIVSYVENTRSLNKTMISAKDLEQASNVLKVDKYYIMLYIRFRDKSLLSKAL